MTIFARNRLIVALDFESLDSALQLAEKLSGIGCMFKIGSRLFTAAGPESVRVITKMGAGVFLDLKFHDIPNTVAGAIRAGLSLPGVRLVNIHALGGALMMAAAAQAKADSAGSSPSASAKLIGVTVLTSMDARVLRQVGIPGQTTSAVMRLARLAKESGLDGVVASAHESQRIRKAFGSDFVIVNPGVRPRGNGPPTKQSREDDQRRVATPAEAIRAGADYVVVGRPIAAAADPHAAAEAIIREIESA